MRFVVHPQEVASEGEQMVCFEIWVNGERLCTAGVGDFGGLSAILKRFQFRPEEYLAEQK